MMRNRVVLTSVLATVLLAGLFTAVNADLINPSTGGGGGGGSVTQGTTPWVDDITQWANTALGAPTAVGTEASGNVPTVNAHITNAGGTTVQGFTPNGNYGVLTTASASNNATLPAGASVAVANIGQAIAYVNLGTSGAVTATSSDIPIAGGQTIAFTVGSNTFIAGISPGSATNLTLIGGTGAYSGTGGAISLASPANDVKAGPFTFTAPTVGQLAVSSQGSGAVGIQITGTNTGVVAAPQGSVDGTTWATIVCYTDDTTGSPVTSMTGDGLWRCPSAGLTSVRLNLTAISTGSAIVTLNASAGSTNQPVGTQGTAENLTGIAGHSIVGQDPCAYQAKTNVAISTASGTTALVAGVAAKKIYICSMLLVAPSTVSVSLSEGSGTTCGTSAQAAVIGVATNGTAANGVPLAANTGWTLGNGEGTVANTATAANYLCLFQSGTAQLAGNLTYVQQ